MSEQSFYNLANRAIEQEMIPALEHFGVGLLPWSPLARGVLAGRHPGPDAVRRASDGAQQQRQQLASQLTEYEALCDRIGHAPAEVAQAWLLHQPAATAVIAGSRTTAQLEATVSASEIVLDAETLAELDRIWPGPGTALQSYAW